MNAKRITEFINWYTIDWADEDWGDTPYDALQYHIIEWRKESDNDLRDFLLASIEFEEYMGW